jgi:protein-disulfide isomerase
MRKNYLNAFVVSALAVSLGAATACQPKSQKPGENRANRNVAEGDAPAAGGEAAQGEADATLGERFKISYSEKNDLWSGAKEPLVTVVEYTDIQCPFCSRLANSMHDLEKQYPDDVRVVVKHFPLPMHKDASLASQAILAAKAQGKGWEMHDKLFANQRALQKDKLIAYATELGVADIQKFTSDLESGTFKGQVEADTKSGKTFAVRSTPSFFMNGKPFKGALPIDKLKAEVDKEIATAKKVMADKGIKRGDFYGYVMKGAKAKRDAAAPKGKDQKARAGRPDASKSYAVPTDGRPSYGPDDALVTIVEFSDFQCPFCSRVNPTIAQIKEKYPKDVRIVFRQQPLPMHKEAPGAAKAALAAANQGKFWEMHDALFENSRGLNDAKFTELAKGLGLDLAKFDADRNSPETAKKVAADQKVARQFGANGTPAFFVNGRFVSGAQPFDKFEALIKEEKAKAEKFMAAKGVAKGQLYDAMRKTWETEVKSAPPPPIADNKRRQVTTDGLPSKGNTTNPKITIVECSDFDCPFCSRATGIVDQVMKEYGDKVAFYFRHYPLPMHKNAEPAHRAAIAAGNQGKFWEMHDLLFADKSKRSEADFEAFATQIGLDVAKFKKDWAAPATAQKVKDDMAQCQKNEVRGAPGFLINGRLMSGAQPFPRFKTVLDEELKGGPKKAG